MRGGRGGRGKPEKGTQNYFKMRDVIYGRPLTVQTLFRTSHLFDLNTPSRSLVFFLTQGWIPSPFFTPL